MGGVVLYEQTYIFDMREYGNGWLEEQSYL